MNPLPAFYDDLDATLAEALRRLALGVSEAASAFHRPVVATMNGNGHPRLRTVVLRGFEGKPPSLRFHTDLRAPKVLDLRAQPQVAALFYDAEAKIQIRLEGWATVHGRDAVGDAAWASAKAMSRQCYGIRPAPGDPIAAGGAYALPEATEEATAAGRENFGAVVIDIANLEWLYLASQGHRRAYFDWTADGWTGRWLTP